MNRCHIYVDGTWLFKQCGRGGILPQQTMYDNFYLDFTKFSQRIKSTLAESSGQTIYDGSLWYYTSIIRNIPDFTNDGISLAFLQETSTAKERTVDSARDAGYDVSGVFEVPFQHWMPKRIIERTFQEKMVDTSLVARMVLSCIDSRNDFQYLVI